MLRRLAHWVRKSDRIWDLVDEDSWRSDTEISDTLENLADAVETGRVG